MIIRIVSLLAAALAAVTPPVHAGESEPLVIAHRGASGYLPEHTMESKVMAYMMGADYIEQDVVLTRDDHAVVLHDIDLDAVTDVARRFPGRARDDGRHYVIDFDLDELRTLAVHERVRPQTGQARYPNRFPAHRAQFRIHTLDEELALIRALDAEFGRDTGIHVELKDPAWHRLAGKDIAAIVLAVLDAHDYRRPGARVFIQSFDDLVLERLGSNDGAGVPLVQLIADERWWPGTAVDYARMRTPAGLAEIAHYADGVGVWLGHAITGPGDDGVAGVTTLVGDARNAGLAVHLYTLRRDALPAGVENFDALLKLAYERLGVDGVFTDFPDLARQYLDTR